MIIKILLAFILIAGNGKSSSRCHEKDSVTISSKIFSDIVDKKEKIYNDAKDKTDDLLIKSDDSLFFFKNIENDQIIAVDITAGAQTIYIFHNKLLPNILLNRYNELIAENNRISTTEGDILNITPKRYLLKKTTYADTLDIKYFRTRKGVSLGMTSNEIKNIYGPPNEIKEEKAHNIRRYIWHVYGKYDEFSKNKNTTKCDNIDEGYDYIVDFKKHDDRDEAVFIFIEHRMP